MNSFLYMYNYALGLKSIIDHFIVSKTIFDVIVDNCVLYDPTNPSTHNVIKLLVDCFDRIVQSVRGNVSSTCAQCVHGIRHPMNTY